LAAVDRVAVSVGRDINLDALQSDTYSANYGSRSQQGTALTAGGNIRPNAGQDINLSATQAQAGGAIGVTAWGDINLDTARESDYHFAEKKNRRQPRPVFQHYHPYGRAGLRYPRKREVTQRQRGSISHDDKTGKTTALMLPGLSGTQSGSAAGTTGSAIAGGTLIIRDQANQQQDVTTLSHDTADADGHIDKIFDKKKVERDLVFTQAVGRVSSEVVQDALQYQLKSAKDAARDDLAKNSPAFNRARL